MDNLWTIVNFAFLALAVIFLVRWWFLAADVRKIRRILEERQRQNRQPDNGQK